MDPRLEEACHTGNLGMLHILLREDKLLLHRFSSSSSSSSSTSIDNPLHIAASLGHTDVADEIMIKNPGLATDLNPRGLSALHLASAHGHLEIVKLLISKVGVHLCSLKDKDGSLAVHIAAMKGRIDILEEHMKVWPESARALTCRNESILHLAVQTNSFETVEFLLKKLAADDDNNELLNLKDDKGNTILHHAVARRQLPSVKLLLSKGESVEVNARNHNGLTALDVLLEAPREYGDLILAEMIRAAGGKIGREVDPHQPSLQTNTSANEPSPPPPPPPPPSRSWVCSLFRFRRRTGLQKKTKKQGKVEDNYTPGQLMVVATLIATITFQAGLNPPGGFTQGNGNSSNSTTPAGVAVLDSELGKFLLLDMVGLFASLSIILILICAAPRQKKMMTKMLVVIMWTAVFSTALAFPTAIYLIFPGSNWMKSAMVLGWFGILAIFMAWVFVRCAVYLLRKVGWWRKKEGNRASDIVRKGGCLLWLMKVGAMMFILFLLLCLLSC